MTALSAGTVRERRGVDRAMKGYGVVASGEIIYPGALVSRSETAGTLISSTSTAASAGHAFVGVYVGDKVATAGDTIEYMFGHQELFACESALDGLVGISCVAEDDNTVTTEADVGTAANRQYVGMVLEAPATGSVWVWVLHFANKTAA